MKEILSELEKISKSIESDMYDSKDAQSMIATLRQYLTNKESTDWSKGLHDSLQIRYEKLADYLDDDPINSTHVYNMLKDIDNITKKIASNSKDIDKWNKRMLRGKIERVILKKENKVK